MRYDVCELRVCKRSLAVHREVVGCQCQYSQGDEYLSKSSIDLPVKKSTFSQTPGSTAKSVS